MMPYSAPPSIVVRGDPSDDAVLCTGNRTFELKIAETSNALLLSPGLCLPTNPSKCAYQVFQSYVICGWLHLKAHVT